MSEADSGGTHIYERYASTRAGYGGNSQLRRIFDRDFLPFLPVDRAMTSIDLGCGQGDLVSQFHLAGYREAQGIDFSREQVEVAHERGNSYVQLGDYVDFLQEKKWHVITATDFLEHLSKDSVLSLFLQVRRALQPGGVLIARVPNAVSPLNGNYQHGDFTHQTTFTASSVRQLALLSGYAKVVTRPFNPIVHGPVSAGRRLLWAGVAAGIKLALAAETGVTKGHIVTQNMNVVLWAPN